MALVDVEAGSGDQVDHRSETETLRYGQPDRCRSAIGCQMKSLKIGWQKLTLELFSCSSCFSRLFEPDG
jgi:hypothetical protein